MPIEFRCTTCQRLLRVPDGASGRQARCPGCGAVVTVPTIDAAPSTDAAPDPQPSDAAQGFGPATSPFAPPGPAPDAAETPLPSAPVPPTAFDEPPSGRRNDASLPETQWAPSPESPFAPREPAVDSNPFASGPAQTPPISDNPYASPSTESITARPVAMDVYSYASMKLQTPAVGLIVTGSLGLAGMIPATIAMVFDLNVPAAGAQGAPFAVLGGMIGWLMVSAAVCFLLIFGGLKMKRLENYNLSLATAIVAIVPCWAYGCGCSTVLGIVFGIWGVVVLCNAEVRVAFDQAARAGGASPPTAR